MTDKRVLALDAGSQSLRAVLFDQTGHLTAQAAVAAPAVSRPDIGFAESDPDDFWTALCAACAQLAMKVPEQWRRVAGIAVSAQRGSMIFLDRNHQPTRPAILWSDERRARDLSSLPLALRLGTRLIGARRQLEDLRAQAPANWVSIFEPRRWERTSKVVLLSAYLNFRLGGQWLDSESSQVGFVPFNFRQRRWYPPGHWRWAALGQLRPAQMVALRPPGSVLGTLTHEAAEQLALPTTTPLIAAAADKACEVLGSGARAPGDLALSFATAVTVNVPHARFRNVERFIPAFPAATPNGFLSEAQLVRGFRVVPWFERTLAPAIAAAKGATDRTSAEVLETYLTTTPAGADGVSHELAREGLCASAAALADGRDDALTQFALRHEPAAVYRAFIEAILLELRTEVRALLQRQRGRPTRVVVAGGGTRSPAICQMAADVLGMPLHLPAISEATALGASMCAASGLGWYPSVEKAQRAMYRSGPTIQPDTRR